MQLAFRNYTEKKIRPNLLKLSIANFSKRMMHNILSMLRSLGRISHDMNYRNELGVSSSNGTHVREFSGPECRDNGSHTLDSSVPISGVSWAVSAYDTLLREVT